MTAEEVFGQITTRQINGFMMHEQFADYFDFLGLKGYKRCHEYHYYEESAAFRRVSRYYIGHYGKLLKEYPVNNKNVIPDNWRVHTRQEVDIQTKKSAIKESFQKWENWESETKAFYEKMYSELISINEIAGAKEVMNLIEDVDNELKAVTLKHLELKADDYDMSNIVMEQQGLHDKYKKMMKKIKL